MNLPNQLTVARFFLTLFFVAALSVSWRFGYTAALGLFLLAGLTDYADGEIARRYKLETDFGKLMDPLVDKIMVAAAFICLVEDRLLPGWAAVVIISREFLITGLRLLALSKGVVLAADNAGKHKTAWQMITVIFFLTMQAGRELFPTVAQGHTFELVRRWGGGGLVALALALTLYSGANYLWRNRTLIEGM